MPELATPGRYALNLPIFQPERIQLGPAPTPPPIDTSAVSQSGLYSSIASTLGNLPEQLMKAYQDGQKRAFEKQTQAVIADKIKKGDLSGIAIAPTGTTFKQPDPLETQYKQAQIDALKADSDTRKQNAETAKLRASLYAPGGARDPLKPKPTLFDLQNVQWGSGQPTGIPQGISPAAIDVNPLPTSDLPQADDPMELMGGGLEDMEPSLGLLNDLPVDATNPANYAMPTANLTAGDGGMPMEPTLLPQSTGVKMNIDGSLSKVALPDFNPTPVAVAPARKPTLSESFDPTAPVRKATDARDPSSGVFTKIAPDGTKYQLLPGSNKWTAVKSSGVTIPATIKAEAVRMGIPIDGKSLDEVGKSMDEMKMSRGIIPPSLRPLAEKFKEDILRHPTLKNYAIKVEALESVRAGIKNPEAGGFSDMALTEGFQRLFNPGASVRQGTIKSMQEAAGWLQSIDPRFAWGKAVQGDKFSPEARARLSKLAEDYFASSTAHMKPQLDDLRDQAESFGIPHPDKFVQRTLTMTAKYGGEVPSEGAAPGDPVAAASPSAPQTKPKQVKQNGVVYTLQPDGSYK